MLFTTATAKSDEKLNRLSESGVLGQCERTTQGRECFGAQENGMLPDLLEADRRS
jgi:hypothetical protein